MLTDLLDGLEAECEHSDQDLALHQRLQRLQRLARLEDPHSVYNTRQRSEREHTSTSCMCRTHGGKKEKEVDKQGRSACKSARKTQQKNPNRPVLESAP